MSGLNIVSVLDNWSTIAAIVGPIIGFIGTAMLWLNGSMKEMRAEHREYMKQSDEHWREMFMYFNSRLDNFHYESSGNKTKRQPK